MQKNKNTKSNDDIKEINKKLDIILAELNLINHKREEIMKDFRKSLDDKRLKDLRKKILNK